jgi:hypothetical protein
MVAKKNDKSDLQKDMEANAASDQYSVGHAEGAPEANPFWQSANVITNDSGGTGTRIEDVSPAFSQARAAALEQAVEEVGEAGPNDHVVLPEDGKEKTNKEAVADLKDSAKHARKEADAVAENNTTVLKDGEVVHEK